ncbi:serine/threonine-protein kinase [Actinomadura yumaensis]|uniref:serine/threonine-protein kinase n=1 Tax=Actinomadura yumaensis TaxID=111807 RepID=UPI00361F9210
MVAFAATGVDIYDAPNDAAVCVRIIRGDHDLSGVPDELRGLLGDALAGDPEARPGAGVLVRRLRALRPDSAGLRVVSGGGGPAAGQGRPRSLAPIGPYRPLQRLGSGGMGDVYLARADDGRMVAIKTLHPFLPAEFQAKDRLRREVEAMRRIRSPNVVELVDSGVDGDPPYIVTRYVEGASLLERVKGHGPLPRDGLLRLAGGLARALAAVHAAESVHRDVNPGNVMLVGGEPILIDFGIAYLAGAARLTQGPVGTPGYVSPEVLEGRQAGPPTDVFGWAATVAYAATGRRAYEATSPAAFVRRVLTGTPDLNGIDADLREVLEDALTRDPGERPSAAELEARFANPGAIAPGSTCVRSRNPLRRHRNRNRLPRPRAPPTASSRDAPRSSSPDSPSPCRSSRSPWPRPSASWWRPNAATRSAAPGPSTPPDTPAAPSPPPAARCATRRPARASPQTARASPRSCARPACTARTPRDSSRDVPSCPARWSTYGARWRCWAA